MDQISMLNQPKNVLILGCGDLGQAAAQALFRHNITSLGIRRTPTQSHIEGLTYQTGDIRDSRTYTNAITNDITHIIFSPTPDNYTEAGYQDTYVKPLRALLAHLDQLQYAITVVFISSTSVYGDNDGQWIDETTPALATGFNGKCLREAERCLEQSRLPHLILRLSGIYSAKRRRLLDQLLAGRISSPLQLTNRIHIEDAARAIAHCIAVIPTPTGIICVSDDEPATQLAIGQWLYDHQFTHELIDYPSEQTITGKRISNQKLRALKFELTYPSFKNGYAYILENGE